MIAMAIANDPSVLDRRRADDGARRDDPGADRRGAEGRAARDARATILITHDLGLIAELADRVVVMYAGRVVELSDVFAIFNAPGHPYTVGLLNSLARLDADEDMARADSRPAPEPRSSAAGLRLSSALPAVAGPRDCRTDVPAFRPFAGGRGHALGMSLRRGAARCRWAPERPSRSDERGRGAVAAPGPRPRRALLRVEGLVKHFPIKAGVFKHTVGQVRAVDGVDLTRHVRARRSESSASRAAGRRRSAGRS